MECVFCQISRKKTRAWVVYENKKVIAFFDNGPATEYHTLIVPKKHYENIYDIPKGLLQETIATAKEIAALYKKKLGINAVDVVQASGKEAGQDVFHFHIHLIPRHAGDDIHEHSWWTPKKYDFDKLLEKIKG